MNNNVNVTPFDSVEISPNSSDVGYALSLESKTKKSWLSGFQNLL